MIFDDNRLSQQSYNVIKL